MSTLTCCLSAFAKTPYSVDLHFREGSSIIDTTYRNNSRNIAAFAAEVRRAAADTTLYIDSITIVGAASPSGMLRHNRSLSMRRAYNASSLLSRLTYLKEDQFTIRALGIDWESLLDFASSAEPSILERRAEVVHIITSEPEAAYDSTGAMTNSRRHLLAMLDGGHPFHAMQDRWFPSLQRATLTLYTSPGPHAAADRSKLRAYIAAPELDFNLPSAVIHAHKPAMPTMLPTRGTAFALGTNLLLDAAAVPNVYAELPIGRRVSVWADWMYAWWNVNERHFFWRTYGGNAGLRLWLGTQSDARSLTGHHLGVYGGVAIFDVELGGNGVMGGQPGGTLWDRPMLTGAIEYGYSLPLSRRLNLDLSIAAGYFGGEYREYEPTDRPDHYLWTRTLMLHYFGPVKAQVGLTLLIGGNDRKKGGGR